MTTKEENKKIQELDNAILDLYKEVLKLQKQVIRAVEQEEHLSEIVNDLVNTLKERSDEYKN